MVKVSSSNSRSTNIPVQEQAHVKEVKDRITRLFNNEKLDRIPVMMDYVELNQQKEIERIKNSAKAIKNHEFDLAQQLKAMKKYLSRDFRDDRIFALLPYVGGGSIASAFGGKARFFDENDAPWIEPIINSIEDIDKLKPDIKNAEIFNIALEKALFFQKKVDAKVPIKLFPLLCPVGTAGMIMSDTELFIAMSTHPKKVHKLLSMITETLIEMVEKFQSKIENLYSLSHIWWLPYGIHMSDDHLAVLSPSLYEEFSVPYNEIIGKRFGGLFLHSCGDYTHNSKALLKMGTLKGVDFHEFPLKKIVPEVGDKLLFVTTYINYAFMTFQEKENKTDEELKKLCWQNLNDLDKAATKRLLFRGQCFEKQRLKEYFYMACEKATKLIQRN